MSAQERSESTQLANQTITQFETQYAQSQSFHPSHIQSHNQSINQVVHPIHPSPVFHPSINQSTKLPLLYDGDQQPFKRSTQSIGFSRNEQISSNMNLSIGWGKSGQLIDWESINPYAERDERDRQERLARGEIEQLIDYTPQWQKELPPIIMPVSAPTKRAQFPNILGNQSINQSDDAYSQMFEKSESAIALKSLIEKRAADRSKAQSLIDECAKWEPFATGDSQFFVPDPSNYTEMYHNTSKGGAEKVQLIKHQSTAYLIDRQNRALYRGKNQRWTEERLFFRGYHTSDDYDDSATDNASGSAIDNASGSAIQKSGSSADLLFDAPLYSSFSADKIFHEPRSKKKMKTPKLTKVKTPRMTINQSTNQSINQTSPQSINQSINQSERLSVLVDSVPSHYEEESKEMIDQSINQSINSPSERLHSSLMTDWLIDDVIVPCITMPHRPIVRFISSTMLPMQKPRFDVPINRSIS